MSDVKKLNADIKAFAASNVKMRDRVQVLLVRCAAIAHDFDTHKGNADPFTNLVAAAKGLDAKAIIAWAEKHAPVIWRKGEDGVRRFAYNKSFKGEDYNATVLLATPWWEMARDAQEVASTVDFYEQLQSFIKRMEREVKAGTKQVKHAEVLNELRAVSGKMAQQMIGETTENGQESATA